MWNGVIILAALRRVKSTAGICKLNSRQPSFSRLETSRILAADAIEALTTVPALAPKRPRGRSIVPISMPAINPVIVRPF